MTALRTDRALSTLRSDPLTFVACRLVCLVLTYRVDEAENGKVFDGAIGLRIDDMLGGDSNEKGEVCDTSRTQEFKNVFVAYLEDKGIHHHVTDSHAPRQNGKCERHGGVQTRRRGPQGYRFQASGEELATTKRHPYRCGIR